MTLEEAIDHAEKVAEKMKERGFEANYRINGESYEGKKCYKCAAEHMQLAEWLKELKQRREMENHG